MKDIVAGDLAEVRGEVGAYLSEGDVNLEANGGWMSALMRLCGP